MSKTDDEADQLDYGDEEEVTGAAQEDENLDAAVLGATTEVEQQRPQRRLPMPQSAAATAGEQIALCYSGIRMTEWGSHTKVAAELSSLKRKLEVEQQDNVQQRRRTAEWQQQAGYESEQRQLWQGEYHSLHKETADWRYEQEMKRTGL
jgi:hypothetical protein